MAVIENRSDYTGEALAVAREEILFRKIPREDLIAVARKLLSAKLKRYLDQFDVVNDQLQLPESYFLNEEEVKAQFMTVFAQWKSERDDMIPDGWQYVLGMGLG